MDELVDVLFPSGAYERFSAGFLISISLPTTNLEYLIRNLIFNSLNFKQIAFIQCPPLLAIPLIWNHLLQKEEVVIHDFSFHRNLPLPVKSSLFKL